MRSPHDKDKSGGFFDSLREHRRSGSAAAAETPEKIFQKGY
jgi:hypothetical protein